MGSFTQIELPHGRYVQLKCGYDECDTYQIGDKVKQWLDPQRPMCGLLLDGVHDADQYSHDQDASNWRVWVIIREAHIIDVIPRKYDSAETYEIEMAFLLDKYRIKPYSTDLWSVEAWANKAKQERYAEVQKQIRDVSKHGLPRHMWPSPAVEFLRQKFKEPSMAELIFNPPPRRSKPGEVCSFCNNSITEDVQCHGCGHYDPPTNVK